MNVNYYLSVYNKQKVLKSTSIVSTKWLVPGVSKETINPVPRIGEKVLIKGTMYSIKDIVNNFDTDEIAIMLMRHKNGY